MVVASVSIAKQQAKKIILRNEGNPFSIIIFNPIGYKIKLTANKFLEDGSSNELSKLRSCKACKWSSLIVLSNMITSYYFNLHIIFTK